VITDAAGIPLAVILSGGHRNDVTQLLPLLDAIPPIRGLRGRPRRRPGKVYADRGYDHNAPSPGSCLPTAPYPLRTPRRHPPGHDQPGLFDHLPSEPAPLALSCQGKNPARVCTNHSGSSSQG
jgi:hypothetical protein